MHWFANTTLFVLLADGTLIEMSIGNNQQARFKRFPGDDVATQFPGQPNWNYYNTPTYPLIDLSALQYSIRAIANTSMTYNQQQGGYLPKGYRGVVCAWICHTQLLLGVGGCRGASAQLADRIRHEP